MDIKDLKEFVGENLDGYIIKSFHIYNDKVNITLVKNSDMKSMTLSYEEFEMIFGG